MKKKHILAFFSTILIASMISACGNKDSLSPSTSPSENAAESAAENTSIDTESFVSTETDVQISNPWRDATKEEALRACPYLFTEPADAQNVHWQILEETSSADKDAGPLVQLDFDLDGMSFTARAQKTNQIEEDLSGMYFDWTYQEEITLSGWGDGNVKGKTYRFVDKDAQADLCTWYDTKHGISYSVSVVADDLDGFDIQAIAEELYDPSLHESNAGAQSESDHTPMDITGCDTFTQIVDRLDSGMGYVNTTLGGNDVLLVSSGTFDAEGNGKEPTAAIDAEVYLYVDGVPTYIGYIEAGGTAYPLCEKDGYLYVGGNHFVQQYTITQDALTLDCSAWVEYQTDGSETYFTTTNGSPDTKEVPDDSILNDFYTRMESANVLIFSVVE